MLSFRSVTTLLALLGLVALLGYGSPANAAALGNQEICDSTADYFLGVEDYPEAIQAHMRVLAAHPNDALALYHLGFAYGMMGQRSAEIAEYDKAVALGLRKWDLFLNLGLAYLESGDSQAAAAALTTATLLGPAHPEAHYNLALADERLGQLESARREIETSLRLDPNQPDARNMLGLIYAEQGNFSQARQIWLALLQAQPDFAPARQNLAILKQSSRPHTHATVANSAAPHTVALAALR